MNDDIPNEEIVDDRKPKASRWGFPRLDHPLNLQLNQLRGDHIARIYLQDGVVAGYADIKDAPRSCAVQDDEVTKIVTDLAGEFGWDMAGSRVLHLRSMMVRAGKMPEPDIDV